MSTSQWDLFAAPPDAVREQIARAGRDEGIERAQQHAERESPGWSDRALQALKRYVESHEIIVGPDFRRWAREHGVEMPPNQRAWGGVFLKAAHIGLIVHHGYTNTGDETMHKQVVKVWRRAT